MTNSNMHSRVHPKHRLMLILLIIASITDGITQGILILQEKIARDSLNASAFEITLIGVIASTTIIFSLLFACMYSRKSKKWLLVAAYLSGRLIFLFAFFISNSGVFLIFLALYHAIFSIQIPVTNSFFPYYFGNKSGFYFGITRSVLMFFMMIASLGVGKILDHNPAMYRWILIIIAFASLITYAIFFWIESQIKYEAVPGQHNLAIRKSIGEIIRNSDFMVYELLFMIYGFAFMISLPTVNLFLIDALKLSNVEMANAKGIYSQLFIILLTPFAGRVLDKFNIWKVGAVSYGILVLYPLFFILSSNMLNKPLAYIGLLVYSLGISGVGVMWNLGTVSFSKGEDLIIYQGVHQSLTGVRGFIGPLLGYFLLLKFGYTINFYLSLLLFLLAAVGSIGYYKMRNNRGIFRRKQPDPQTSYISTINSDSCTE